MLTNALFHVKYKFCIFYTLVHLLLKNIQYTLQIVAWDAVISEILVSINPERN